MNIGEKVSAKYPTPNDEYRVVSGKIVGFNRGHVFLERAFPRLKHYMVKKENIIIKEKK